MNNLNTFGDQITNYMRTPQQRLRRQLDRLEKQKAELLELIRPLSPEVYMQQPQPTTWSVAQAANHLYLSEKLSTGYLHKKLSYPDTVPPYHLKSEAGILLLKFVLGTSFKVKAPKMINMWDQQPILSQEQLADAWATLRQDMRHYLEEQLVRFPNQLVYRHPFAGRLNIVQTVHFFNLHMAHHIRQVRRILQSLGQT